MSTEKLYLHKRAEGGNYYLLIVDNINGNRVTKKISTKTKNKNQALSFLRNYKKKKEVAVLNPHLKLSDIQNPVPEYVKSNLSKARLLADVI